MNRKRFVKLLMSRGVRRNTAEAVAKKAQRLGVSYFKLLGDMWNLISIIKFNASMGRVVIWQTPDVNVCVEVLVNG